MGNFKALNFLSTIYIIVGWLIVIVTMLVVVTYFIVSFPSDNYVMLILGAYAFGVGVFGITLVGYGEFIALMLKIENNTRK